MRRQRTFPISRMKQASADQSHMGRSVKRITGLSPARFTELMQTEESFGFIVYWKAMRQQHGPAASPNSDGT